MDKLKDIASQVRRDIVEWYMLFKAAIREDPWDAPTILQRCILR